MSASSQSSGSSKPPAQLYSSSLYAGIFAPSSSSTSGGDAPGSAAAAAPSAPSVEATPAPEKQTSQVPASEAWSAALRFAPRAKTKPAPPKKPLASTFGDASMDEGDASLSPTAAPARSAAYGAHASAGLSSAAAKALNSTSGIAFSRASTGPVNVHSVGASSSTLPQRAKTAAAAAGSGGQASSLPPLGSRYRPVLHEAPPTQLPEEVQRRERELVERDAEMRRGDARRRAGPNGEFGGAAYEDEEGDEGDVNGFWASEAGRSSKKKKSKRKRSPGAAPLDMDAEYDPRLPNSYADYMALRQARRHAARRFARAQRGEEAEVDEWDAEALHEEEERRNKFARFAPPPGLYAGAPAPTAPHVAPGYVPAPAPLGLADDDEKPYLSITPPPAPRSEAAEAEWSPSTPPRSSEPDLEPRSQGPPAPPGPPPPPPPALAPPGPPPGPPPAFPGAPASQPTAAQAPSLPADFAARQSAAAAIAARLAASFSAANPARQPISWINPSSSATASHAGAASDKRGFAARMMAAQGWRVGEGIGAEGNKGIVKPLTAERAESGAGGGERRNMGSIVDANAGEIKRAERERFGEPSPVILLENMVAPEEMDDDLPGDVGDECAKHGFVERVAIWPSIGGVRIFVKFTGHAGAYRCVHASDGRYFAGKIVRARYYDDQAFARGEYDLP